MKRILEVEMHALISLLFVGMLAELVLAQPNSFLIEFTGNKEFSSERLEKEFAKCPYRLSDGQSDKEFESVLAICLRGTVFDIYASRGMDIREFADVSINKLDGTRRIKVGISEPEPVFFASFRIERSTYVGTQAGELEKRFPIKKGERMNYPAVADYINSIRRLYDDKGFLAFDVDVERSFSRDHRTDRLAVDLVMTIQEDGPFVISGIEIVRNYDGYVLRDEKLTDGVVRNALGLSEGDVYNDAKLQVGLKKLNSMCWHCDFASTRQSDKFTIGSGSSRGMRLDEDYENRTVRIIIYLYEPVLVSK